MVWDKHIAEKEGTQLFEKFYGDEELLSVNKDNNPADDSNAD